jgi:hypothetical protein
VRDPTLRTGDRGVSDVVAFVLTFTLIIGSVSIVYAFGMVTLDDIRATEQMNSADRSMQELGDLLNAIHRETAPSRTTELGLGGGQLTLRESTVDVTVTDEGSGTTLYAETLDLRALSRESDRVDTVIAYEGGAVFRRTGLGVSVLRNEPVVRCTDSVAVVSLVQLRGQAAVGAEGSVGIRAVREHSGLAFPNASSQAATSATNVTVDVQGSRNEAGWRQFFEQDDNDWAGEDGRYYCDGVDTVYVRTSTINVQAST